MASPGGRLRAGHARPIRPRSSGRMRSGRSVPPAERAGSAGGPEASSAGHLDPVVTIGGHQREPMSSTPTARREPATTAAMESGFRPGRWAHQALDVLREGLITMGGGWVLEVDIRSFFDTLDHGRLRAILRKRVQDGVLLCLIGKWLHAGAMEAGGVMYPGFGTPQRGVISPLLANIFLHEVLDTWFENEQKPRLKGRAFLVRYAD